MYDLFLLSLSCSGLYQSIATIPTSPSTPPAAAAAARGTFVAAASPSLEAVVGSDPPPALDSSVAVAPSMVIVSLWLNTEVDPLSTVAGRLVVKTLPILVMMLTTVTFPLLVGSAVAALRLCSMSLRRDWYAALASLRTELRLSWFRITLRLCWMELRPDWYCEGTAVRKGGGVAAVRAEETMELMLPLMEEDAAADWMATARPGRTEEGKY